MKANFYPIGISEFIRTPKRARVRFNRVWGLRREPEADLS